MSGIITLIPGDTDPGPEIVNGNERSELDNRSHINHGHWSPAGHRGHSNLSVTGPGHGCILTCSLHKLMKKSPISMNQVLKSIQYISD